MRYVARTLLKSPSFSITVVATLTLAIGANIAIFTLANALLLASLPVPKANRLVRISRLNSKRGEGDFSIPAFRMIQQQTGLFSAVFAWLGGGMETFEMNGVPFPGSVDDVVGDYYGTLGIKPALGRFLNSEREAIRLAWHRP